MKLNVGNLESFVRIFSGVALLYSAIYGYVGEWGFVGVVLIATGLSRFCPITTLLGINTYRCEDQGQH